MGQPQGEPVSLATRNLLRGLTMKVPSGQRVAKAMRLPVLAPADLADIADLDLQSRTPLWFYILREAHVAAGGEHLGPVGGRIVAEVLVGLVQGDRQSYLRQDPDWTPTYGSGGTFTAADLLRDRGRRGDAALTPGAACAIVRRVRGIRLAAAALLAWSAGCGAAPDPQRAGARRGCAAARGRGAAGDPRRRNAGRGPRRRNAGEASPPERRRAARRRDGSAPTCARPTRARR